MTKGLMNSLLELHDSRLAGIIRRGAFVCVNFTPAYFHWSAGQPGRDPGEGWVQDATLWFDGAEIVGLIPESPCDIVDGELRVGGEVHLNAVPVPFKSAGSATILMSFSPEHRVAVSGSKAWLELLGDPKFVDEFPA
jgi:hypothetical protein